MDILADSLAILWRFDVALALIVGSVGGVIIGAIPGVGPAVAIAILLPATFSLEPIVGLTALLGIYWTACPLGGALAALAFRVTNFHEFDTAMSENTPLKSKLSTYA